MATIDNDCDHACCEHKETLIRFLLNAVRYYAKRTEALRDEADILQQKAKELGYE